MRINLLRAPFNFHRSRNEVLSIAKEGEYSVPGDVPADMAKAAIETGYAIEVEKPATPRHKSARKPRHAADKGQPAGVDRADLAPDDSADGGAAVADAG